MRTAARGGLPPKSLICGVFCLFAAVSASAQNPREEPAHAGWIDSPFRNFGPGQPLLAGRAVLFDESDDGALSVPLSAELRRLFGELYVRQGWRVPFADGEPLRIFVARKEAGGVRRVAARAVEDGRLVDPAILLDARGLTTREIVREVARQVAVATLEAYGVSDSTFLTAAAAELLSSHDGEEEEDAARIAASAPELSLAANPNVLGRLFVEEVGRGGGPAFLRLAWETASETGEAPLPILMRAHAERTGETGEKALLRFGARLYATVESEVSPSRLGLLDLESGALDASPASAFTLRHRTYVASEPIGALRVSWPEDGGAAAVVVRYRDASLPADVLYLSAGDVRAVPLGGVARLDWIVAGASQGGSLRAPAAFETAAAFPYGGLTAHASGGPEGPRIWWSTASHEGLAGWAIFREEVLSDGRIARTGPEILPSSHQADEPFGYAYLDPAAGPATYYRYTIWAVTEDGLLSRAFSVTLRTPD